LNLAKFEIVDQLWEQLVKVEPMGLLQNELQSPHSVLKLVAFECFTLDLVNSGQNLLEAILQVVYALPVNLLHFHAFFSEFGPVFICNFLDGD